MSPASTPAETRTRRPAKVTAPAGDALDEAIELTRRLRLPHVRRQLTELIPTARAQRWDPAELVRVLLAEEAAGRDAAMLAYYVCYGPAASRLKGLVRHCHVVGYVVV